MTSGWWETFTGFLVQNAPLFRIIGIVLAAILVRGLFAIAATRVVGRIQVSATQESGKTKVPAKTQARIMQRATTLGSVLRSIINWGIGVIATILVLSELGFEITAIIAGFGILGAGVALGAQDIVRDIFNGTIMVFEDQIGVGDTVDLGEAKGVVEAVTVRVTKVRSKDGTLWFVRNGQIQRVGNKSQPSK
jgi:small conductance mechanosensitive channel